MPSFEFKPSDIVALVVALLLGAAGMRTSDPLLFAICWAGAAAVLVMAIVAHQNASVSVRVALSTAVVALAIWISWSNYTAYFEGMIRVHSGIIYPDELPRPLRCGGIPEKVLAVYFGGGAAWTDGNSMTVLLLHGEPIIQFQKIGNGEIRLSDITVLDDRDQVAAKTIGDKFEIYDIAKGYLPTKSHLYVKDYKGDLIFDVQYINKTTVLVGGRFSDRNGSPITISEKGITIPGFGFISQFCMSTSGGIGIVID